MSPGLTSKRLLGAGGACALVLAISFAVSRPDSEAVNVNPGARPAAIPGVHSSAIEPRAGLGRAAALPALGSKPRPRPVRRRRAVVALPAPEPPAAPAAAEPRPAPSAAPPPPASTYIPPPAPVYEPAPPPPVPAAPPPPPDPAPLEFDDSG